MAIKYDWTGVDPRLRELVAWNRAAIEARALLGPLAGYSETGAIIAGLTEAIVASGGAAAPGTGGFAQATGLPNGWQRPNSNWPETTYYPMCNILGTISTGAPVVNRLFFIPFVPVRQTTIDQIAFDVSSPGGGGSVGRIGIYNADQSTLKPTTLILDGGDFATTGAGLKTTIANVTFQPGVLYFGASIQGTVASTNICLSSGTPMFGFWNSGGQLFYRQGWYLPFTYGSLPADVTSNQGSLVTSQNDSQPLPFYRVASIV